MLASLSVALPASAQKIDIPDWKHAVKFELVSSQEPIRPGDSFEVALLASIQPGYHLYGPNEPEPSRTRVSVAGESLQAGKIAYPPVVRRDLSGLGEYDLYEGQIAVRVPVTASKSFSGTNLKASLQVEYQLCTDFACSAPTKETLSLDLRGSKPGSPVEKLNPEVFRKQ